MTKRDAESNDEAQGDQKFLNYVYDVLKNNIMFETTNELIDALISQRDKKELENKIVIVVNELANEGFEINDIKNYIIKMIDDRFYITK